MNSAPGEPMQFLVHGIDADGVEAQLDELVEAHWAYMDGFAAHLVARGPTLSHDGEAHTGSIHILEAADLGAADRFAHEEPFAQAGLYASVTITPWWNVLGGTMWDRPPASADTASTLVIARWPARVGEPGGRDSFWHALTGPVDPEAFVFGGLLLDEDGRRDVGVAFALDLDLPDTQLLATALGRSLGATSIVSRRWCRGGRPIS